MRRGRLGLRVRVRLRGREFAGEVLLAEGFEEDKGDAVGEVEGARGGIKHGDAKPVITVLFEEVLGEAGGFAAEDEVVVR